MGKHHQVVPDMDRDNDSTESCDENQNETLCPHIGKAVDFNRIKKNIKPGNVGKCPRCVSTGSSFMPMFDGLEFEYSLWLCLRCGNQACGRNQFSHALEHFNTPMSDCHSLCVNTSIWTVWCYECDTMVNTNSKKKLLETVEWLKKHISGHISKKPPIPIGYYTLTKMETNNVIESVPNNLKLDVPRARGLSNLGNTCFFNAVVQCLAQTPFLQPLLLEMSEMNETFKLPGGKLSMSISAEPKDLPPLEGSLSRWGPLTEVLYNTLKELTSGRADVYTPRPLLSELTHRQPAFGGGDQHDSHELLRCLLELVRTEDLKRYHLVILEKLGLTRKTQPNTVEGCTKQILKFYGQQASDLMIRTDQIFRGILVSTLQCQDCKHSSHREEFFLDLSLPVSADKQMPPALRRKTDIEMQEPEKPSKCQLKKEKRATRKARKHQAKVNNAVAASSTIREEQKTTSKSNSEESDGSADIEDNLEECKSPGGCEDPGKGLESGYNSEKVSDISPVSSQGMDPGATSPMIVSVPSPTCADGDTSSHSGSSELNVDLPSPQFPSAGPEDYERPISRLSFSEKPIRLSDGNVTVRMICLYIFYVLYALDKPAEPDMSPRLEPLFGNRMAGTVSARYQCDDGECSIQSCLNQFTACELMTGNNKVRCENCTKNINGEGGKGVDTNATKQLLIFNPPAILILHLKRFQVSYY